MRGMDVSRRTLYTAVAITSLIGAATGVVSYSHGLYVARDVGNTGLIAWLVPGFADGLILLSSNALYAATQSGVRRPAAAYAGLITGILVTVVMNVSAGWHEGWGGRLVAALAPTVFLLSLEVLFWLFRLSRGTHEPAKPAQCPHGVPGSVPEAIRADYWHRVQCLGEEVTYSGHATRWGADRRKMSELVGPVANGSGPGE
jgi:hypothetical protein